MGIEVAKQKTEQFTIVIANERQQVCSQIEETVVVRFTE